MAATIVPIAASVVMELIPKIPDIVKYVEGLFGPKTGDTKLKVATDMVTLVSQALAAAGKLSGNPTVEQIAGYVQSVVTGLNATGQLGKPGNVTLPVGGISNGVEGSYIITVKRTS